MLVLASSTHNLANIWSIHIWLILPYLAQDRDFIEMFLNEARLAAHLNHPNVVKYYESFIDAGGCLCVVMEYCEKGDLASFIKLQGSFKIAENKIWKFVL